MLYLFDFLIIHMIQIQNFSKLLYYTSEYNFAFRFVTEEGSPSNAMLHFCVKI